MVRGWQRVLLVVIALGILLALLSPYIPDPLSVPGKKAVTFVLFVLAALIPQALLAAACFRPDRVSVEAPGPDRLALICSRLC